MIKKSILSIVFVSCSMIGYSGNWTNLVAEIATCLDAYRDVGGHYFSPSSKRDRIVELDAMLVKELSALIAQNVEKELCTIQTEPPVEFRVFPTNVTSAIRGEFHGRSGRTIYVNYRRYSVEGYGYLYICENSLWNERPHEGRINVCTYAVFVGEQEREISKLLDLSELPYSEIGSPRPSDIFLGFVPNSKSGIPHVAFLTGPAGSGSFWGVQIYTFDPANNQWMLAKVYKNAGFRSFSYDEKTTILSYRDRYEARETAKTINIGELANTYGYFSDLSIQRRAAFQKNRNEPRATATE